MPKKTYEINGFAKGINKVSSPLDLDKEECIEAQGVFLDSPGKITRRLGAATTVSSTFSDGNDQEKTAGYVVVGAGATPRVHAKQGAYVVHGDLNYSSNIEHAAPVQAALGDTGNDANQTNLVVTDVTSRPTYVVFGGKDAIDKDGAALYATAVLGDVGTYSGDGQKLLAWAQDTNRDGNVTASSDFFLNHNTIEDSDSNYFGNNDVGMYDGASLLAVDDDNVDISGADHIAIKQFGNTGSSNYNAFILFRVGASLYNTSDYSAGMYGSSLDVTGMDINFCFKSINIAEHVGVGIILYSGDNSSFDYQDGGNCRLYRIPQSDWASVHGLSNGTYKRITLKEESYYHSGASFNPTGVKIVAFQLWQDDWNGVGADTATTYQASGADSKFVFLSEISFSESVPSTWAHQNYKFYETHHYQDPSGDVDFHKQIESVPTQYTNTLSVADNTGGIKVKFHKTSTDGFHSRIYYQLADDNNVGFGDLYQLADVSEDNGVSGVDTDEYTAWDGSNHATLSFPQRPIANTYTFNTGWPQDTKYINARWRHAAVVNNTVYIGYVEQDATLDDSGYDTNKILKASPGKLFGFSDKEYINIDSGGYGITAMRATADRLWVWTLDRAMVINVAQEFEFVEDTIYGAGVEYPGSTCLTNNGLAWSNTKGVWIFDGEKIEEVAQSKLIDSNISDAEHEWKNAHLGSSGILFDPIENRLIVCHYRNNSSNEDGSDKYYSLTTKAWCGEQDNNGYTTSPLVTGTAAQIIGNSAIANDSTHTSNVPTLVYTLQGVDNTYYTWLPGSNSSSSPFDNMELLTGRITMGDGGMKKKFMRMYVDFETVGGGFNIIFYVDGSSTGTPGTVSVTESGWVDIDAIGYDIQFRITEINNTTSTSMVIDGFKIVYRELTVGGK